MRNLPGSRGGISLVFVIETPERPSSCIYVDHFAPVIVKIDQKIEKTLF